MQTKIPRSGMQTSSLAAGVKAYLIYFVFRRQFGVVFARIVLELVFLVQIWWWILKLGFND